MNYPFPATIRHLVEERMESGRYASEDEVLVRALQSLKEYDEAVADIQEGLDDEAAGRVRPLGEFDAEVRQTLGLPT
jgi:Arc/MetJ-type ribon-helix-helix transcriptional regulator